MTTHDIARPLGALAAVLIALASPDAHADPTIEPDPHAYAIVVGSNLGGEGQKPLRYAEDDAARVADVLRELGGYRPERVHLLRQPSPEDLLARIERVGAQLRADRRDGVEARFFFYYSGHARAGALDLGSRELPLEALRDKLSSLESALTIVVLDACQSGAFSRVKGAEPAADFSFNSVARLNATGMAVMASSSASELSQESENLRSSYFTHHLLVALRGAGDDNRDGRVSLDEAYEYAYQRTLVSTAATAVGSQHVTLETELAGRGAVPLSYPQRSDSRLALGAGLEADILIHVRPSGAVVAEVHKSRGQDMRLALPHGAYRVMVRLGDRGLRCDVTLAAHHESVLLDDPCTDVPFETAVAKGPTSAPRYRYGLEIGGGFVRVRSDRYLTRLEDFGFHDQTFIDGHLRLSLSYYLQPSIELVFDAGELDAGHYRRDNAGGAHDFSWSTLGAAASLRWTAPDGWFRPFAQAGAGLARASTTYAMDGNPASDAEAFWGYQLGAAAGVHIVPWPQLGAFLRFDYNYAPVIENLLGDVHDSGGFNTTLGIRTRF